VILGGGVTAGCLFIFVGASRGHLCDNTALLLQSAILGLTVSSIPPCVCSSVSFHYVYNYIELLWWLQHSINQSNSGFDRQHGFLSVFYSNGSRIKRDIDKRHITSSSETLNDGNSLAMRRRPGSGGFGNFTERRAITSAPPPSNGSAPLDRHNSDDLGDTGSRAASTDDG